LRERGNDVPIWVTEESVVTTSFLDQLRTSTAEPEARYHFRNACYELVRTYTESLANGVSHIFYYELADPWRFGVFAKPRQLPEELSSSMWDEGQMLHPIAAAHAALADQIADKTFFQQVDKSPLRASVFTGSNESVAVIYGDFGSFSASAMLELRPGSRGGDLKAIDFMDNEVPIAAKADVMTLPLSREPVYLRCRGKDSDKALLKMLEACRIESVAPGH
jgi:hypothetical protein